MSEALGPALGGEFHLPEAELRVCTRTYIHTMEAKKHDPSLCSIRHPPKNPLIAKTLAQGRRGGGGGGLVCTEPTEQSSVEAQSVPMVVRTWLPNDGCNLSP